MALGLPVQIGRYHLEQYLGGGMAEVYRATDTVLHRPVAFKLLTQRATEDKGMRDRFLHEARLGSQASHPNIVNTLDYGEEQGRPFIVLEFLEGHSLQQAIKDGTVGDTRRKLSIAMDVAKGLSHVHSLQIFHRDIKPDNVHIDGKGHARLIDFGIAKLNGASLTQAGFVLGTPHYMPPEQLRGQQVTERTDIYAWALVLIEMFTGKKARSGTTMERIMMEILNEPVDCSPLASVGMPESVVELVKKCTQADPQNRPANFGEVIPQLEAAHARIIADERAVVEAAERKKKILGWSAAAGAALLAAIAGGIGIGEFDGAKRRSGAGSGDGDTPHQMAVIGAERKVAIDLHEVSNERYQAFAQKTGRRLPPGFLADQPSLPVVNISVMDAEAFCSSEGKRLPTEAEWMLAARGESGEKRAFPWGSAQDPAKANVQGNPQFKTPHLVGVDSMEAGVSPYGVHHLAGNVREWVADRRPPSIMALRDYSKLLGTKFIGDEDWRLIKGGSYQQPLANANIEEWDPAPAKLAGDDLGFRCAKTLSRK